MPTLKQLIAQAWNDTSVEAKRRFSGHHDIEMSEDDFHADFEDLSEHTRLKITFITIDEMGLRGHYSSERNKRNKKKIDVNKRLGDG